MPMKWYLTISNTETLYGKTFLTRYGVAMICRLLKIIGLFCRISSLLYGSFAIETYDLREPTNRSHTISGSLKSVFSFAKEPYKRDYILQKRPMI